MPSNNGIVFCGDCECPLDQRFDHDKCASSFKCEECGCPAYTKKEAKMCCCEHQEHENLFCLDCGKEMELSDYYNEDEGRER